MMPTLSLSKDFLEFLQLLNAHSIKYVIALDLFIAVP